MLIRARAPRPSIGPWAVTSAHWRANHLSHGPLIRQQLPTPQHTLAHKRNPYLHWLERGFLSLPPHPLANTRAFLPAYRREKAASFLNIYEKKNSERGRYVRVVFLERSFCCNFCFFDDNAKSVTDTGVTMRTFPTLKGIIFNLVRKCTSYDTDIGRYLETYPFTKYTLGFDSNPDISISTRRRDLVVAPN